VSAGKRLVRIGLLATLLTIAAGVWLYNRLERPSIGPGGPSDVVVYFPSGTSTSAIFRRLASEGVIFNAKIAEIFYRIRGSATPLQAGEYRFSRPTSLDQILDRMGRGEVLQHVVVVPEGLTAMRRSSSSSIRASERWNPSARPSPTRAWLRDSRPVRRISRASSFPTPTA
jgi:UPF0755 protein